MNRVYKFLFVLLHIIMFLIFIYYKKILGFDISFLILLIIFGVLFVTFKLFVRKNISFNFKDILLQVVIVCFALFILFVSNFISKELLVAYSKTQIINYSVYTNYLAYYIPLYLLSIIYTCIKVFGKK